MKTYDVKSCIENNYNKYPSGSLSPREVLTTLSTDGNDDALAFKVNSAITVAIFRRAEEYVKSNPVSTRMSGLTSLIDIKIKIDDRFQRNAELSAEVIKAINKVIEN